MKDRNVANLIKKSNYSYCIDENYSEIIPELKTLLDSDNCRFLSVQMFYMYPDSYGLVGDDVIHYQQLGEVGYNREYTSVADIITDIKNPNNATFYADKNVATLTNKQLEALMTNGSFCDYVDATTYFNNILSRLHIFGFKLLTVENDLPLLEEYNTKLEGNVMSKVEEPITLNKLLDKIHEYSESKIALSIGVKVKYGAIRIGFTFNTDSIIDIIAATTNLLQTKESLVWMSNNNTSSMYFIYNVNSSNVIPVNSLTVMLQTLIGSSDIPACNILINVIDMLHSCGYQAVYKDDSDLIQSIMKLDNKRREIEETKLELKMIEDEVVKQLKITK